MVCLYIDAKQILKKIVDKGGIMGQAGALYFNDEKLATHYIIECSRHLHRDMLAFWGEELCLEIEKFSSLNL